MLLYVHVAIFVNEVSNRPNGGLTRQCLFYGLDDDLRTGLVFYGRDHSADFYNSADGTIFYRPVLGRLEMHLIFLWTGR